MEILVHRNIISFELFTNARDESTPQDWIILPLILMGVWPSSMVYGQLHPLLPWTGSMSMLLVAMHGKVLQQLYTVPK